MQTIPKYKCIRYIVDDSRTLVTVSSPTPLLSMLVRSLSSASLARDLGSNRLVLNADWSQDFGCKWLTVHVCVCVCVHACACAYMCEGVTDHCVCWMLKGIVQWVFCVLVRH